MQILLKQLGRLFSRVPALVLRGTWVDLATDPSYRSASDTENGRPSRSA